MTPEQFLLVYPMIMEWIRQLLSENAKLAQRVSSANFKRLPFYLSNSILESTKFVVVDKIPVPPLSAWGLSQFSEFEKMDFVGITYIDTFFVRQCSAQNEKLFFHELIHVLQWRFLKPERFLIEYVSGLEANGYENSLLELMAYDADKIFAESQTPFDAEKKTIEQLSNIYDKQCRS